MRNNKAILDEAARSVRRTFIGSVAGTFGMLAVVGAAGAYGMPERLTAQALTAAMTKLNVRFPRCGPRLVRRPTRRSTSRRTRRRRASGDARAGECRDPRFEDHAEGRVVRTCRGRAAGSRAGSRSRPLLPRTPARRPRTAPAPMPGRRSRCRRRSPAPLYLPRRAKPPWPWRAGRREHLLTCPRVATAPACDARAPRPAIAERSAARIARQRRAPNSSGAAGVRGAEACRHQAAPGDAEIRAGRAVAASPAPPAA